jgi:1-acyl-sn-glycerol-3-phosphate acyltransferase
VTANTLAFVTLGLLALALVAWIVRALGRLPFTPFQSALFCLNYALARILWRAEVLGSLCLPPSSGAVIVCNHRGSLDPSFLYLVTTRLIYWMVAEEFFDHPVLGFLLRRSGTISVHRGGIDTAATKTAIRYAQEGNLIGLFPEGRINETDQFLLPGRSGAALIALKARVPVIPCYLGGSPYGGTALSPLLTPAKARLVIGKPIDLSPYYGREDDREVLGELTKRFLREIAQLAGRGDFEPRLAGRSPRDD